MTARPPVGTAASAAPRPAPAPAPGIRPAAPAPQARRRWLKLMGAGLMGTGVMGSGVMGTGVVGTGVLRAGGLGAAVLAAAGLPQARATTPARPHVEVWKDPSCGCCQDWIAHMQAHGFALTVHDSGNTAVRKRLGIALEHGSCHTARVDGYAIEGHVPAREVQRLLRERPRALGLAVPGMPVGSPGMDGAAYGARRDAYDVLLLRSGGGASIYQSYR